MKDATAVAPAHDTCTHMEDTGAHKAATVHMQYAVHGACHFAKSRSKRPTVHSGNSIIFGAATSSKCVSAIADCNCSASFHGHSAHTSAQYSSNGRTMALYTCTPRATPSLPLQRPIAHLPRSLHGEQTRALSCVLLEGDTTVQFYAENVYDDDPLDWLITEAYSACR